MAHKMTRSLRFDQETIKRIGIRDRGCIFCNMKYAPGGTAFERGIFDVMHYIPKSHQGLGIEQNGAQGCRYHHHMLDNGNKGAREEMLELFKQYLMKHYPGWSEENLVYQKYDFKELN